MAAHAAVQSPIARIALEQGPLTRADLAKTAAYLVGYVALGIILPEKLTQNPESTYTLQPHQIAIPTWNHIGSHD